MTFLFNAPTNKKQKGSAIVLAVFIIIVVMMIGTAMMKMFTTSSESIVQEVLGTRALAAANSAMQGDLQKLFPLNNGVATISCPTTAANSPEYDFSTVVGLYACKAQVTCSQYAEVDGIKYYRLVSTGTCGTGIMAANSDNVVLSSRKITVEARDL